MRRMRTRRHAPHAHPPPCAACAPAAMRRMRTRRHAPHAQRPAAPAPAPRRTAAMRRMRSALPRPRRAAPDASALPRPQDPRVFGEIARSTCGIATISRKSRGSPRVARGGGGREVGWCGVGGGAAGRDWARRWRCRRELRRPTTTDRRKRKQGDGTQQATAGRPRWMARGGWRVARGGGWGRR